MVKFLSKLRRSAYWRKSRAPRLWKVLTQTRLPGTSCSTRCRISPAALLVKVIARMLPARTPCWSRYATRRVMTRVLPEPAPARTRSGPSPCCTASRWAGFSPASSASVTTTGALASLGSLASRDAVPADVLLQHGRHLDAAVGLLVVLQQTRDGTRKRQPRPVERMHEARLLALGRAKADVRAARLKVREVAARRDFEPRTDAG